MKKKTIPTAATVKKSLEWLKANREKVRHFTAFGEDNWHKIEADIAVIEEDLSEDDIYNRSNEEGEDDDSKEWDWTQRDSALYTRHWLDGDEKVSPIDNWKGLVGK